MLVSLSNDAIWRRVIKIQQALMEYFMERVLLRDRVGPSLGLPPPTVDADVPRENRRGNVAGDDSGSPRVAERGVGFGTAASPAANPRRKTTVAKEEQPSHPRNRIPDLVTTVRMNIALLERCAPWILAVTLRLTSIVHFVHRCCNTVFTSRTVVRWVFLVEYQRRASVHFSSRFVPVHVRRVCDTSS